MLKFQKTSDFDEVYKDMLQQFPKEELKTRKRFMELFEKNYCLYKIYDGEFIGYILSLEYNNYFFIDYFAILKKFHSKGYGSKILTFLQNQKDLKGIFLEVEKPDNINQNKTKRIKFYENNNAKKLDVNYLYPVNNDKKYIEMLFYYIPSKINTPAKTEVNNMIKHIFKTIHSDIKHHEEILNKIIN